MASTATTTEEVTVALPADLLREVDEVAAERGRGRDDLLRQAVFYYVRTYRWRQVQAVFAPAFEAAGLRTEEDVEEYLDSLDDEAR